MNRAKLRSEAKKLAHKVYGQCGGNLPIMGGSSTNITTSIMNVDRSVTNIGTSSSSCTHHNYNSSTTTNTYNNNAQKQITISSSTSQPTADIQATIPTATTLATRNAYKSSHPTYSSSTTTTPIIWTPQINPNEFDGINGINNIDGICQFKYTIAGIKHLWCYVIYNNNAKFQFAEFCKI